MTRTEFLDRIGRLEQELPVRTWRIDDLLVWPIIRIYLYATSLDATSSALGLERGLAHNLRTMVGNLSGWARATVVDWRGNVRPTQQAEAVFLAYSMGRQPLVDGRAANSLLQPYVDLLAEAGHRSVVWEMSPTGEYNVPRGVPSALIQPVLFGARLASMRARTPSDVSLEGYEVFVAKTQDMGRRYRSITALARDAAFVELTRRIFRRWIRRTGARYGFVADYALPNLAFCQACHDEGVETIEIQHGVQGSTHPVYTGWRALPSGGYPMRPRQYWCWDAESAAFVNEWAHPAGLPGAVVGGNPWRDRWLDPTVASSAAMHHELRGLRERMGARRHVLVTLDPTGDAIPPILLESLRRAPSDWGLWVRLHPVNQAQRLPEVERLLSQIPAAKVPVSFASTVPLHALLAHVDVHVTACWSSVIGEAASAGVSSIACHPRAEEVFPELLDDGRLVVSHSADEILAAIERQATRKTASDHPKANAASALRRVLQAALPATARPGAA